MKFKQINGISIILFCLTFILCWQGKYSYWFLIIPFLFWLIITSFGVFEIRLNYFLNAFHQGSTKEKVIALTFDDGPTPFSPRIVEILNQHHAKATFFCIGKNVAQYPEILKNTFDSGHIIGNHTYHHSPQNGFYSSAKIVEEINSTDQIIEQIIHQKPTLFRPPFGVTNPHIANAIKETNHKVIGWSVRSLDTVIEDEEKLLNRIKRQLKPGSIVLMHDTSDKTANVLEQLFVFLQQENYKVVPLNQLLNIEVYEN